MSVSTVVLYQQPAVSTVVLYQQPAVSTVVLHQQAVSTVVLYQQAAASTVVLYQPSCFSNIVPYSIMQKTFSKLQKEGLLIPLQGFRLAKVDTGHKHMLCADVLFTC